MKHILLFGSNRINFEKLSLKKKIPLTKLGLILFWLVVGMKVMQAQVPGPVLFVCPADGDYAWTSGTKNSHQLNASGDSIYFLDAADDLSSFPLVSVSPSSTAACSPADRRVQVDAITLVLPSNDIQTLNILGNSSGTTSVRTLRALFVDGVEVPAANYTLNSDVVGNPACGKITITGLNIAAKARVTVVFGSSTTSTPQNFRVNVIYVNETALPIKLVDFQAQKQAGQRLISWKISDGNEPATYTVERSQDGRTFSEIAVIKSNGNSSLNYVDHDAVVGNLLYYRLKITGTNGSVIYSKISALNIGSIVGLQLTPNPVKDGPLYLTFGAIDKLSTLKIINIAGQVLETRTIAAQREQAIIETSQLKPGVYFVQLINGQNLQTQRFIKQ